jgi:hypothetical protein
MVQMCTLWRKHQTSVITQSIANMITDAHIATLHTPPNGQTLGQAEWRRWGQPPM